MNNPSIGAIAPPAKILVTRRWPDQVESALVRTFPGIALNASDRPMSARELQDALATMDCVLPTVTDTFTAEMLLAQPVRTRYLGNFGVGYSNINTEAAQRAGIVVTNTPGVLTDATADLAMTLILMVARRAGEGERQVRSASWPGWSPTHLLGSDVTGKTLGIIGMGRIGGALARRASLGFGMQIRWYNAGRSALDPGVQAQRSPSLQTLLRESDFVSINTPGGATNRTLIGANELADMKRSAFLINTARGEVIDSAALISALRGGAIAGAGLDVYEREPDVPEELLGMENVVVLPHMGSATVEARNAMGFRVLTNLKAFLAGAVPTDRVG